MTLDELAKSYTNALIEYYRWLPAQESSNPQDRQSYQLAADQMYAAHEALNQACRNSL